LAFAALLCVVFSFRGFQMMLLDGPLNCSESFDLKVLHNSQLGMRRDGSESEAERGAIVMRTNMPIRPKILLHIVEIQRALKTNPSYQSLDLVILCDETNMNGTEAYLQQFFDKMADVPIPAIHPIDEKSMLEEFPRIQKFLDGTDNLKKNGGLCCGRTAMWMLIIPPFVSFAVRHNYSNSWHLEEDAWAVGKTQAPIVELIHQFNVHLRMQEKEAKRPVGLAATRMKHNRCPSFFQKVHHTESFHKIVEAMEGNPNKTDKWNEWDEGSSPEQWRCLSDSLFRHSRSFSQFLHDLWAAKTGSVPFQQHEGLQQPLAWHGRFLTTDLETLLPQEHRPSGLEWLLPKTENQSVAMHKYFLSNTTVHIYHDKSAKLNLL